MTEDEKTELRRRDRSADGSTCDYTDLIDPPEPCANCGYHRRQLPAWARHGAVFAVGGRAYRIVSVGTTNRGVSGGRHLRDVVRAEPIAGDRWGLPDAPCPTRDVASALDQLFGLPEFTVEEIERAIHLVGDTAR